MRQDLVGKGIRAGAEEEVREGTKRKGLISAAAGRSVDRDGATGLVAPALLPGCLADSVRIHGGRQEGVFLSREIDVRASKLVAHKETRGVGVAKDRRRFDGGKKRRRKEG